MTKRKSWSFLPLFLVVASLVGALCANSSGAATSQYTIGFTGDLTGPVSILDVPTLAGLTTAVDATNAAGGVNGHKIHLIGLDQGETVATSEANIRQFVASGASTTYVGGFSNVVQAVMNLGPQLKIPIWTGPSLTSTQLKPPRPYLYSAAPASDYNGDAEGAYVAKLAAAAPSAKRRIGVLGYESAGTDLVRQEVVDILTKDGHKPVSVVSVPGTATDATSAAEQVAATHPNIVAMQLLDNLVPSAVKALRAQGFTGAIVNFSGGSPAEQEAVNDPNYQLLEFYASPQQTNIPAIAKMDAAAKKFGQTKSANTPFFTEGYAAGLLITAALKSCGFPCSGAKMNTVLRKTDLPGSEVGLSTTYGATSQTNDWATGSIVIEYKNGKLVIVDPNVPA